MWIYGWTFCARVRRMCGDENTQIPVKAVVRNAAHVFKHTHNIMLSDKKHFAETHTCQANTQYAIRPSTQARMHSAVAAKVCRITKIKTGYVLYIRKHRPTMRSQETRIWSVQ